MHTGRKAEVLAEDETRRRNALAKPFFDAMGDDTLRLDYPLDEGSLVLDLGGYRGQFASDVYGRFRCRVLIFEPETEFCAFIRRRFKDNPSMEAFDFGLADKDCEISLVVDGSSTSAFGGEGRRVTGTLKGVGAFFAEKGLSKVDLLKINIEGGEYDLLDAMLDQDLARKVRHLQIQFHDHVPEAAQRAARIRERLRLTHELQWSFPWVWESWRLMDAIPEAGGILHGR